MIAVICSDSRDANLSLAQKKDSVICTFKTAGINPSLNDEKYITNIFNKSINLINHAEEINRIYFFGAGTFSKEQKTMVTDSYRLHIDSIVKEPIDQVLRYYLNKN